MGQLSDDSVFLANAKTLKLTEPVALASLERLQWIKKEFSVIPEKPGVYYFMGSQQEPLYIGKSIQLRSRLKSHVLAAREDERISRYVLQAQSLKWRETAGDLHAQLLENREIKSQFPLFNRAQRRVKRFFTWQFSSVQASSLELVSVQSETLQQRTQVCYGFYKSAKNAKEAMKTIADREGLCLGLLGLEKVKGACFRSQIHKCFGACAGKETLDAMLERLFESLLPLSFQLWPHPGILQYQENGYWHALYQWQSLGLFSQKLNATQQKQLIAQTSLSFDKDEYQIIKRALAFK